MPFTFFYLYITFESSFVPYSAWTMLRHTGRVVFSIMPVFSTAGILAALPHPAHLQNHISTLIVTPLPITHVIPHATLPCPCAWPAARKGLENKDRARCHQYHALMSLELWGCKWTIISYNTHTHTHTHIKIYVYMKISINIYIFFFFKTYIHLQKWSCIIKQGFIYETKYLQMNNSFYQCCRRLKCFLQFLLVE